MSGCKTTQYLPISWAVAPLHVTVSFLLAIALVLSFIWLGFAATLATFPDDQQGANNSFKPKPLRSRKGIARKACHAFGSTSRFGLTAGVGRRKGNVGF